MTDYVNIDKINNKPQTISNNVDILWLGSAILKYKISMKMVDDINNAYDKKLKELTAHNDDLAGKIKEENLVNELMTDYMNKTFQKCFAHYVEFLKRQDKWICSLNRVWINEMRANEYNPLHNHTSTMADVGMSSVLMLKRPSTYGVEYSREETPMNGHLDFTGGQQDPLSISQGYVDAQVGEFYVFPYTLLHGVYPFNGTDEVRRTLSYNCDLIKPSLLHKG